MNRFEGKVVIVTGAGSGTGTGTARRFLREGTVSSLTGGVSIGYSKRWQDLTKIKRSFTPETCRMRHTCGAWLRTRLPDLGAWTS